MKEVWFSCFRVLVATVVLLAGSQRDIGSIGLPPSRESSAFVNASADRHGFSGGGQPDRADVERGKQTFMRVGCYQCHGREAQGASTGPRLGPNPLPVAAFARAIRTPRNDMPPYSIRILSDSELTDVYAFVAARPRPHELPK